MYEKKPFQSWLWWNIQFHIEKKMDNLFNADARMSFERFLRNTLNIWIYFNRRKTNAKQSQLHH